MPAQLQIKRLSKVYTRKDRSVEALAPIDLTIGPGESVVIIGPNGSGKSTLLKLLAGIEQPSTGTITGIDRAAYLPQQPSLLPWRTVEQNLLLPRDVQPAAAAGKINVKKLLKDFGLEEFATFYPHALSGGMQQKVALLRTVICDPALLLLDEPFAPLDAITRLELQRWLLDLKRKLGCGLICVTHDIREAVFLADTIYVLSPRPGRIKRKFHVPAGRTPQNDLANKLYALLVPRP